MYKKVSFLSLLFLASACATQSPVAKHDDVSIKGQELASKDDDKPKVVCKYTQTVGTKFKKKQCWTRKQYEEMQSVSQEEIRRLQRSTMAPPEVR